MMSIRQPTEMTDPHRQRGMALVGWLVLIFAVGSTGTLAIRTIPHYIDYHTMISVVEALPQNEVHVMSTRDIRSSLAKRFKVNNIRDLKVKDILGIERKRDRTALVLKYEVREHLLYNIDLVLVFSKRFDYT